MELPGTSRIDLRVVAGGVLFGVGWGLGGFCPGPALVALAGGFGDGFVFVAAMLAGMLVHDVVFLTRPPEMRPSETPP